MVPWGLRKLLNWIKERYDNPLVIITENGFSDKGHIHDKPRMIYITVSAMDTFQKEHCTSYHFHVRTFVSRFLIRTNLF